MLLYPAWREKVVKGEIDVDTHDIAILLVKSSYDPVGDVYLSDIASGDRIGSIEQLTGVAYSGGIIASTPVQWVGLPDPSDPVAGLVFIFPYTGVESTSLLWTHIDVGFGLPRTPIDGKVDVTLPSPFFRLGDDLEAIL